MASIYTKPGSPFYYLRYKNEEGKWRDKSTRYREGFPSETKKAQALAMEASLKELRQSPTKDSEQWDNWVLRFLRQKYAGPEHERTLARYELAWRNVRAFLLSMKIDTPRRLTRAVCKEYHAWRQNPEDCGGRVEGVLRCGHNNALQDLKILSIICDEAVALEFIETNPAHRLGITRIKAEEKRPFTDDEIQKIRLALREWPDWMAISFELGLHQALRLRQTSFPLSCVDWIRGTISYPSKIVKGSKPFTHPIDGRVRPLLEKLRDAKAEMTCVIPPNNELPSKTWWRFFRKIGIKGVCFHCTRVTWITRAAIAGVPISKAMRFVNHGSEEVHRIYTKLQAHDIMDVPSLVSFPDAASSCVRCSPYEAGLKSLPFVTFFLDASE